MQNNRLIKKVGLYFIGNMSSKILTFLIVPLYAFYINSTDLGYFDYSQTLMMIIVPIVYIVVWEGILKYLLSEVDDNKIEQILVTSTIFIILMSLLIILAGHFYKIIANKNINNYHYIIVMIITYALSTNWQNYARGLKENRIYVISGIVGTFINLIMNILLIIIFKLGIKALFISYILSNLCIFILIEFNLKIILNIKIKYFDFNILKKLIKFSSPLVINQISVWLISGFGRTIISKEIGLEANGLYAFANKFAIIINSIGTVINMAIKEEAILLANNNDWEEKFRSTLQKLYQVFLVISIIGVPIICIFYNIINKTGYSESMNYFPWLLIYSVNMTMTINIGSVFQALEITKYQFITTALGGIFTVIFTYIFIDLLGIYAVLIAQVVGSLIIVLSRYILVNKYVDMKLNWITIIKMYSLFSFISFIGIRVNIVLNIILLSAISIILYLMNKDIILETIYKLKKKYKKSA